MRWKLVIFGLDECLKQQTRRRVLFTHIGTSPTALHEVPKSIQSLFHVLWHELGYSRNCWGDAERMALQGSWKKMLESMEAGSFEFV